MHERYQDIVDFSGINEKGDFITLPMRTYSSGMAARLQFSIAAAKNHDVLMIDEALATGDRKFQTPLRGAHPGTEARRPARSSWSATTTSSIRDTCNQVLWLERGELAWTARPTRCSRSTRSSRAVARARRGCAGTVPARPRV